jgi:hypothetical protein
VKIAPPLSDGRETYSKGHLDTFFIFIYPPSTSLLLCLLVISHSLLDKMRLHAALYATALLAGISFAQEAAEQEPLAADTSSLAERPTFTVCLVTLLMDMSNSV